ncbi:hypothetical protein [Amycolatopsis lexingtonensis]|uniref:hypothetical protein n=1 Tax=Amycolatopsis lexingtonensis TaxID=218822 RepID=UPI003F7128DF
MPEDAQVGGLDFVNSDETDANEKATQELQVRNAAQQILQVHLRVNEVLGKDAPPNPFYWGPNLSVDLSGATLFNALFSGCEARRALFRECLFVGRATFAFSRFTSRAAFDKARFTAEADFAHANYRSDGQYTDSMTTCSGVLFEGATYFNSTRHGFFECENSTFNAEFNFNNSLVSLHAYFGESQFKAAAKFDFVKFRGKASFDDSVFLGDVNARHSEFFYGSNWAGARIESNLDLFGSVVAIERDLGIGDPMKFKNTLPKGWEVTAWPDSRPTPSGDGKWGRLARLSRSS